MYYTINRILAKANKEKSIGRTEFFLDVSANVKKTHLLTHQNQDIKI